MDVLVDLVGDDVMRVSSSALHGLIRLTGKDFGRDEDLWRSWWSANREGWKRPGKLGKGKDSRVMSVMPSPRACTPRSAASISAMSLSDIRWILLYKLPDIHHLRLYWP